ncbi:hypothetical protein Tco_0598983 [Tanacetum coccineum]
MLMDEKINSTQMIQEPKPVILQSESSKSVASSKTSQEAKPNGKNTDSSKSTRPKPLLKPMLKCELSSSQEMNESTPSSSGTQEQLEDFDEWKDGQGTDDDEVPDEEVSPELLDKVSEKVMTSDELQRIQDALNNMLRNRCDPVNQDLFHLKYGNFNAKKYVSLLHKIHAFPFPEDDLEELNTRWIRKTIKRFNLYARYDVDH